MTNVDLSDVSRARAGSQPLTGYLARPEDGGPWPGVVVLHEIFGLDEQARRHTDRLARMGYLALAVDLFSQGGARRCLVATMRAVRAGRGRAVDDIDAARDWLLASDQCNGRTGVIGFCMGGGFALISATRGFDAASVNYGDLPKDPVDALEGACPIVGSYGGRDPSQKGAADKLEDALTRADVPHDVKEYPTASHAFLNDALSGPRLLQPLFRITGVGPDPVAAADAWVRIETFLGEHLTER